MLYESDIDTDNCPNCGSENVSWGSAVVYSGEVSFEFECEDCGAHGEKVYAMMNPTWEYETE